MGLEDGNFLRVRVWKWVAIKVTIGLSLLSVAIACERHASINVEALRWLYFLASIGLGSGFAVLLMELIAPQIEVRFFMALMPVSGSWGMYTWWLWSGCLFFSSQALWRWGHVGGEPPVEGSLRQPANITERLVKVVALFNTVSVFLIMATKVLVSELYSKKHSHKVLTALKQESILADLASCRAPAGINDPPEAQTQGPLATVHATDLGLAPCHDQELGHGGNGANGNAASSRQSQQSPDKDAPQAALKPGTPTMTKSKSAVSLTPSRGCSSSLSARDHPMSGHTTPDSLRCTPGGGAEGRVPSMTGITLNSIERGSPQRPSPTPGLATVDNLGARSSKPSRPSVSREQEPRLCCGGGLLGRVASRVLQQVHVYGKNSVRQLEAGRMQAMQYLQDGSSIKVRRTLLQALYLQYKLSMHSNERDNNPFSKPGHRRVVSASALVALQTDTSSGSFFNRIKRFMTTGAVDKLDNEGHSPAQLGTMKDPRAAVKPQSSLLRASFSFVDHGQAPPAWLKLTSPRRLLDELLLVYVKLTDGELASMATTYSKMVFQTVCPRNPDEILHEDLKGMGIKDKDIGTLYEMFDKDHDQVIREAEIREVALGFFQQRRNLALTLHAMRSLTMSLQATIVAVINGVFLMVVYLAILDVTHVFGANKTSLDFFSAYIVVVSLMFGEQIRNLLSGGLLILAQQPFDIGEELVIEEQPGWRFMGVVQDFNLLYLRIKKSTDGELVTIPLSRVTANRFTNLSRSDWKIEQSFFSVDLTAPPDVLQHMTQAALAFINAHPGEFDTEYGFLAFFHGLEKPNKVIIRTFHRFRFNLSAPHRRIAKARHGIISAVKDTLNSMGIAFTELRMQVPFMPPEAYVPARNPSDLGPHGATPMAHPNAAGQPMHSDIYPAMNSYPNLQQPQYQQQQQHPQQAVPYPAGPWQPEPSTPGHHQHPHSLPSFLSWVQHHPK